MKNKICIWLCLVFVLIGGLALLSACKDNGEEEEIYTVFTDTAAYAGSYEAVVQNDKYGLVIDDSGHATVTGEGTAIEKGSFSFYKKGDEVFLKINNRYVTFAFDSTENSVVIGEVKYTVPLVYTVVQQFDESVRGDYILANEDRENVILRVSSTAATLNGSAYTLYVCGEKMYEKNGESFLEVAFTDDYFESNGIRYYKLTVVSSFAVTGSFVHSADETNVIALVTENTLTIGGAEITLYQANNKYYENVINGYNEVVFVLDEEVLTYKTTTYNRIAV